MPSGVVRNLIRRNPKFVVAIGVHHGGQHGMDEHDGDMQHDMGHDEAMGHDGHDAGPDMRQHAYDQVVEGLQHLAEEYPEAKSFLSKFEKMYASWMGNKAKDAKAEEPAPEPMAEAPIGDKGAQDDGIPGGEASPAES